MKRKRYSRWPRRQRKGLKLCCAGSADRTRRLMQAMQLRVAESYVADQFGNLAKEGNTLVVPSNLSDIASMISLATTIIKKDEDEDNPKE